MATTGSLSLNGVNKYLEDLARAGKDVDRAAKSGLMAGGQVIADGMKQDVPKDTHHLENTIGVEEPQQSGNFIFTRVGVLTDDKETAIYGNVQEFGSSSVEAQPFVRPSFKKKKAAAMKAMRKAIENEGLL